MRLFMSKPTMAAWFTTQVRVIEAWREEVAMHSDIDFEMVTRLEHHYQWLTSELAYLEHKLEGTLEH